MTIAILRDCVEHGREIEFDYDGKRYSITYGIIDGREVISFCEFYKETTEVITFDELLNISRDGVTLRDMWGKLTENDVWIF